MQLIHFRRLRQLVARLSHDSGGLALIEYAFAAPILMMIGMYGVEVSNFALTNLRVSQYALTLADNASRVGIDTNLATTQLREVDINDVLQGARLQGGGLALTTHGRVTLSSLENIRQSYDSAPVQRIHWQRCIGLKSGAGYDSSYGTTSTSAGTTASSGNAGTTAAAGMGDPGARVNAPPGSGVMVVEVNYLYQPLLGLLPAKKIHYVASFIVRDNRDFSQVFNPSPTATRATCNLHTT